MRLNHRKLLEEICTLICHVKENSCSSIDCHTCVEHCTIDAPVYYYPPPTPPIYIDGAGDDDLSKPHRLSTGLIVTISLLSAFFLVFFCYAIYAKFFRSRRRGSQEQETEDTHADFVDEEQGPFVDHPIWYIRTPGLQQSIITAITVCKYKKGEGLIEGTECSVCLSEFEEDENLRLLPKCNHAFHLPCIDTWLRSHTNCPMCRAPIVTNPAMIATTPEESNVVDSSSAENTQIETGENSSESVENRVLEVRDEEAEVEVVEDRTRVCETESSLEILQPRRRSVSLDSSCIAEINLALATIAPSVESADGSSKRIKGSSSFRARSRLQSAPTSMKRSRSYNGKNLLSWYSRSQMKPSVPLRSF